MGVFMDYNNIIYDDGFYLYKDDNFNTIDMQMVFLRDSGNFEDAVFVLLCKYLGKTNKNFKNELELNKKIAELYSLNYSFNTIEIGSKNLFILNADIVSPTVIHDDYSKDAFEFLRQILYEPDFTHEEEFENTKRVYLSHLLSNLSNQNFLAKNLYVQNVIDDESIKYKYSTDEEYIKEMINKITLKDLEEMYHKTVNQNNFLRCLVFGNITKDEYKTLRSKFNFTDNKISIDYRKKTDILEKDVEIPSDTTSESIIYITYSLDDIDEKARKVLYEVFNGSGDLCTNILREKYDLVYASSVQISYTKKYLVVRAKIDKNNKQKLLDAADEMIEIVKDKNKLKKLLESAKKSIKNTYYLISEENYSMINNIDDYIGNIYGKFNDLDFVNNIDSYDVEEVLKYTKTLKKKNVFMYRGDLHE